VLALAASGSLGALSATGGAVGAFTSAVLGTVSPAAAGAALAGFAFAERTTRVRGAGPRLAHVGAAIVGGAMAGALSGAYAFASLAVQAVAVVVAAVLVALPLLIDADDPVAHALDELSSHLPEPARRTLSEGAALRRNASEIPLDHETGPHVRKTWLALLRLAEARTRLERTRVVRTRDGAPADAVVAMVDSKMADHVAALARAYTATDTARAAEAGLDDAALRSVDAAGETLDEVSRSVLSVTRDL